MGTYTEIIKNFSSGMTTLSLDFWGLNIFMRCSSESILEDLRQENKWFIDDTLTQRNKQHFNITHIEYSTIKDIPASIRQMVAQSDPKLLINPRNCELILFASRANAGDALRALVLRLFILHYRCRGFCFFHGSVAERDGNAVAFLGEKGTGKTSLLLDLVFEYNWKFVTDDLLMLGSEKGQPIVYGLQMSVNLDTASDSPKAFVKRTKQRSSSVDRWLLPREEKRRHYLPMNLTAQKTVLKHVIFPTIHPLCPSPSMMKIPSDNVIQFLDFSRYNAKTLPNLAFPDIGLHCNEDVMKAMGNCRGLLFLGGMNLAANSEYICSVLRGK